MSAERARTLAVLAWLAVVCAAATAVAQTSGSQDVSELLVPEGEPAGLARELPVAVADKELGVNAVAISADGSLLAAGGADGAIWIWELRSARVLRVLRAHQGFVRALAFSPQGPMLVSSSSDGGLRAHDALTGREAWKSEGPIVGDCAFSPDGRFVAGAESVAVRLRDAATGNVLRVFTSDASGDRISVAFRPDGKTLAGGIGDVVQLWEFESGKPLRSFATGAGNVRHVAFADATTVATGSSGNSIDLWDLGSGQRLRSFDAETILNLFALGRDGQSVAGAPPGAGAIIWDRRTGRQLSAFARPAAPRSLAFLPDGRRLAIGDATGEVILSEVSTGRPVKELKVGALAVMSIAITGDGSVLAAMTADDSVVVLDGSTGRALREHDGMDRNGAMPLALSPDGRRLFAAAATDADLRIVDARSGDVLRRLAQKNAVANIAVAANGARAAVATTDGAIAVWDLASGNALARFEPDGALIAALALSADGRILTAAVSGRDIVRRWNVDAKQILLKLPLDDEVHALSPDGRLVATISPKAILHVHDLATGKSRTLGDVLEGVGSVAFSADGRQIALGSVYGTIRVRDVATGRELRKFNAGSTRINALAFHPDGRLFSASDRLALWAEDPYTPVWQTWLGAGWATVQGDKLYRHDLGELLQHTDNSGRFEPVTPQADNEQRIVLHARVVSQTPASEGPNGTGRIEVEVKNDSPSPAYWVSLATKSAPPGVLVFPPRAKQRLERGQTTQFTVELSLLRDRAAKPSQLVTDGKPPVLQLQVTHAHGTGDDLEVPLDLRAPELAFSDVDGKEDANKGIVTANVKNTGKAPATGIQITARLHRAGKRYDLPSIGLTKLVPGEQKAISLVVPDELVDRDTFELELEAQADFWPTQRWRYTEPELRVKDPLWWTFAFFAVIIAIGLFLSSGLNPFVDPLVRRVNRDPKALFALSLAELPVADRALRRAKRLSSALAAASIPEARWQRALHAAAGANELALAFAQTLGATLGEPLAGTAVWAIELPALHLRFARSTALVIATGETLEPGDALRYANLIRALPNVADVALALDLTARGDARRALDDVPHMQFVTASPGQVRGLLLAADPLAKLESWIALQRPAVELSPYQLGGGLDDDSLFFGRGRELRILTDRTPRNLLVVGPRQMGKTSLLKAALRRVAQRADLDAAYLSLSSPDLTAAIAAHLGAKPPAGVADFRQLAAGTRERPRLWLIDEADVFVKRDAERDHELIWAMRSLADEGRAYFVLAGYWYVYQQAMLHTQGPLRNFGEVLRLGPLEREAARSLATEPMARLQLTYEPPDAVERLVQECGGRANLVAVACAGLIETLAPTTRVFTPVQIERVLHDHRPLHDQLVFWRGGEAIDRVVVRAALLAADPTRDSLRAMFVRDGHALSEEQLGQSLDRLDMGYVLVPDERGVLRFPIPLLRWFIEREGDPRAAFERELESLEG